MVAIQRKILTGSEQRLKAVKWAHKILQVAIRGGKWVEVNQMPLHSAKRAGEAVQIHHTQKKTCTQVIWLQGKIEKHQKLKPVEK